MMSKRIVLILGVVGLVLASNPIVVIGNNQHAILDTNALQQHFQGNFNGKNFVVETSEMGDNPIQVAKQILRQADIKPDQVDSFLLTLNEFVKNFNSTKNFKQIHLEELQSVLKHEPQAVIYFRNNVAEARLLQEKVVSNSQLFTNMTPPVLSGLFVGLFLIVVLIIAINCLYNIKTNDKFARVPLWVGKQS